LRSGNQKGGPTGGVRCRRRKKNLILHEKTAWGGKVLDSKIHLELRGTKSRGRGMKPRRGKVYGRRLERRTAEGKKKNDRSKVARGR